MEVVCNYSNSILADIPEFLAQNEGWDIFVEPEMTKRMLILLILHLLQWANTFCWSCSGVLEGPSSTLTAEFLGGMM